MRRHSEVVKVSVAATPWGGYGLVAKEEITKGDTVLVMREEAVLDLERAFAQPTIGTALRSFCEDGLAPRLAMTLFLLWVWRGGVSGRYEKFENGKWSEFAPFLALLPPLAKMESLALLPREEVLLLYGSSAFEEVAGFNATLHADFEVCSQLVAVSPALRKAFVQSGVFSYPHFLVVV